MVGIVAGRLKERFGKPAFVAGFEGGLGRGSARSIAGIDIGGIVREAHQAGVLDAGGGHAMAAGFSLRPDQVGAVSRFSGGAFCSGGHKPWQRSANAGRAHLARRSNRRVGARHRSRRALWRGQCGAHPCDRRCAGCFRRRGRKGPCPVALGGRRRRASGCHRIPHRGYRSRPRIAGRARTRGYTPQAACAPKNGTAACGFSCTWRTPPRRASERLPRQLSAFIAASSRGCAGAREGPSSIG